MKHDYLTCIALGALVLILTVLQLYPKQALGAQWVVNYRFPLWIVGCSTTSAVSSFLVRAAGADYWSALRKFQIATLLAVIYGAVLDLFVVRGEDPLIVIAVGVIFYLTPAILANWILYSSIFYILDVIRDQRRDS
jgi:hypothetical protein